MIYLISESYFFWTTHFPDSHAFHHDLKCAKLYSGRIKSDHQCHNVSTFFNLNFHLLLNVSEFLNSKKKICKNAFWDSTEKSWIAPTLCDVMSLCFIAACLFLDISCLVFSCRNQIFLCSFSTLHTLNSKMSLSVCSLKDIVGSCCHFINLNSPSAEEELKYVLWWRQYWM